MLGALVFFVTAAPTGAFAEFKPTAAQRFACIGDAMSLCSSVLMSMDRVLSCLSSKKSQLSTGCRLAETLRGRARDPNGGALVVAGQEHGLDSSPLIRAQKFYHLPIASALV